MIEPIILDNIRRALSEHRSFLVCGHEDLDGDCIGSQLGLYHWLTAEGKQAAVVCAGPTLSNYSFLPGYAQVKSRVPEGFTADVTLCVDTGSAQRVVPGVRLQGLVVNIDHHPGNTNFGDLNWVDPDAAAVGEMIYILLTGFNRPLPKDTVTCLYLAILTDTGSFRYSKTSARTFEVATALVHAGVNPHAIANAYYDNVHPDTVRLTGEVFGNLRYELDGRLVWGQITHEMYRRCGGLECQPEQLASQMRSIRGVEVAVLFHEMEDSTGRASLRSRGRVDASIVSAELGGGGHPSAAGVRFQGDFAANCERILEAVRRHILAQMSAA
jgi:phosphoesterase RecJ-like protein